MCAQLLFLAVEIGLESELELPCFMCQGRGPGSRQNFGLEMPTQTFCGPAMPLSKS